MRRAKHNGLAVSLVVWLLLWIAPLAHALDRDAAANRNPLAASTPKRIALVIGNDAYQKVSKLEKAGNDAAAMARELKAAGFDVILHRDLNYLAMVKAVETLTDRITGGDQVVVFFAGHGVQIKTGSYLLPVDIEASSEGQVEKTAYALADLTDKLSEAKASFALVLVDACRDNPLKSKGRSVGGSRGLSAVEPPKGQMVVYSASKGQQALDRLTDGDANPNGVFTREFIKRMKQPGVRIEDLMREVQDSVETLAQSISHDQRPAVYNEARGSFYFFGPTTVQVQGQLPSAAVDPETQFWREVKSSGTREYFDAYLEQYPKGKFLVFAKLELKKLDEREKAESAKEAAVKQKSDDRERQDIALRQQGERQQEAVNRELRDAAERAAQDDARQRRKPATMRESPHPHHDLDTHRVRAQFAKLQQAPWRRDDFKSPNLKKLNPTPYWRFKLDQTNRLLVQFARHGNETVCLALEVILNHAYERSRFLRGATLNWQTWMRTMPAHGHPEPDPQAPTLRYLHPQRKEFHVLDKVLCFDDTQQAVYETPAPLILVGSAGSGKTALTLQKLRLARGRVLYVTQSSFLAQSAQAMYFAHGFEPEGQEPEFLSYREFVETLHVPRGASSRSPTFAAGLNATAAPPNRHRRARCPCLV
jgi:flagellar biosynthesis GTPase FlhF